LIGGRRDRSSLVIGERRGTNLKVTGGQEACEAWGYRQRRAIRGEMILNPKVVSRQDWVGEALRVREGRPDTPKLKVWKPLVYGVRLSSMYSMFRRERGKY